MSADASFPYWPEGLPRSLDYPESPVGALLAGSARRFRDRVALHYAGRELTFAELWEQACRFANALREAGVGHGDVVAVHMPNCPQYPIAYYGIQLAGATFTPANPLLPPGDLEAQLVDSGARAVVTFGAAAGAVAAVRDHTEVRLVVVTDRDQAVDSLSRVDAGAFGAAGADFQEFLEGGPAARPEPDVDARVDLAHLAYTGGTTGRSKGVRLPHRNVVVNSLQYACWSTAAAPERDHDGAVGLDPARALEAAREAPVPVGSGTGIALTPWFHAMGTIGGLNVPILCGTTLVIHDHFDPDAYLADAERFRLTTISGAPPVFAALLAHPDMDARDLSSVRAVSSGAAPLPDELLRGLGERFPDAVIVEGYGLTEATMGATLNPSLRSALRKPGSVGLPVFDTEVKIVGVDAHAAANGLPPGAAGEVCVRGPQVMTGYHNRPQETAGVLEDGWLRTGDIGTIDQDGYLSILDRKKDMLIYKGYNVYPRELEELLHAHPAVASAAVVGRTQAATGELPVAFVVRAAACPDVTADELMTAVNERVVPYKKLREVHFIDDLPVSAAGKVLKRALRERLG